MSKKYEELASTVLTAVGGKENVVYFQHCTTRLRFNVKDRGQVDIKAIEKTKHVIGTQWSNQELQIIIGSDVADAYDEICKLGGFAKQDVIDENLDGNLKKGFSIKGLLMSMIDAISGSITPLIPMMIGAGMIKVLYMLLNVMGVLSTESTTYQILNWVGDAFIYFFPVFLGATSAKKFGGNQGIGMLLGAVLIYPSFINAVNSGTSMAIFGLPVYMTNYSSTVIPVIISVYVMAKLEKLFKKYSPSVLRSFLAPLLTLVVMIPLMLVVTAPIGYYIGTFVAAAVAWIYETIGFLGVAVLAGLLPLMVITGMHTMMTPYWVTAFASMGFDPFFLPAMIISNLNQATACLGVAIKAKSQDLKTTAVSCAATAYIAGVTEPAMFGITLKYKKPLYAAMIGNFAGGLIAGLMKVACYAFPGSGGLFAVVTFVGPTASNIIWFGIAAIVGVVITLVLTLVLGIEEGEVDA